MVEVDLQKPLQSRFILRGRNGEFNTKAYKIFSSSVASMAIRRYAVQRSQGRIQMSALALRVGALEGDAASSRAEQEQERRRFGPWIWLLNAAIGVRQN